MGQPAELLTQDPFYPVAHGYAKIHQADGIAIHVRCRAKHAGDGERHIGRRTFESAACKLACNRGIYGTLLFQDGSGHPQRTGLVGFGIGHEAAMEKFGGAIAFRQRRRNEACRA